MASRQTSAQKRTVARVMHEFKHGELRRNDGAPVEDPRQAIAVALSEAHYAVARLIELDANTTHDSNPFH